MTCRVARLPHDFTRTNFAYCCECGSSNLEVFFTSKALGPHLCPMCIQSKFESGVVESITRSPRRSRVQARAGTSLENGLQSARRT